MRRMWTRALLLGAIGLAAGGNLGCAEERAPINRVQADALAKSFFVGADLKDISDDPEFYMRGTVVDVPYGAGQDGLFTATYAQPISRIRWQITEDMLLARLSYERVANSDGKGNQIDGLVKKATNDGQVVAAYKISTHFDIRRSYNPTTGEEQNVVEENTTDRPWYDREYMRVDWSQNLATDAYDYDTLTSLGWIGGVEYTPLAYTVLDPADPDAPHFDADAGYFDVTNKAYAKPATIDLSSLGWGIDKIPACMLPGDFAGGTQPVGDCNPIEITLRQSFKKVVDKDYEPVDYDGYRFQAFGAFETERVGYARDYGMTDSQWHRFANRYNIWERSHYYSDPEKMTGAIACATLETTETPTGNPNADPNRDLDGDGTADECAAVTKATGFAGSKCDVFSKKCTLPYAARKPVTIPWYLSGVDTTTVNSLNAQIDAEKDANKKKILQQELAGAQAAGENLFEATNWAVQEWDLALKTAVQTARLTECYRTKKDVAACKAAFPMWVGQQDDNEEAVAMSRDLDICHRKAVTGDDDKARAAGWNSAACAPGVSTAADALAAQRGDPADVSAAAMKVVVPMDPVIALCHNPVIATDHPNCGKVGLSPRLGDIRYNSVLNIDKPQQPSAWGIMVDADDPLTGEKVAASINIWTHITDIAAQSLVDLVKYINGELSIADITEGTYIYNWAQASQLSNQGAGPTISKAQLNMRLAAASGIDAKKYSANISGKTLPDGIRTAAQKFHESNVRDVAVSADYASPAQFAAKARMQSIRGTSTESKLINQPMLQLAGLNSSQLSEEYALDQASPVALNNPKVWSDMRHMRENAMANRGGCLLTEAPEPSSLTGIAKALSRKFPVGTNETPEQQNGRWDAMLNYIRRRYQYAVIIHEMGHSVGLRHNFVSTYASLNYRPQYWQLRTKDGTVKTECTDAVDLTADPKAAEKCVGPRYFDPVTDAEQDQMIWMFMQSDVMDYPGDVSQDTLGLGGFNFAAARMFYGDVTSVYDVQNSGKLDTKYLAGGAIGGGMINTIDNFGGLTGIQYYNWAGGEATSFHYSQLQTNYNLISNCKEVTPTQPAWWDESKDGRWDPIFDGKIVSKDGFTTNPDGSVKYTSAPTKCRQLPVDYLGWNDLRMPTASEGGGVNYRGGNAVDAATKRVRVPYQFASDNWADTGNTSVFRHDNGADPYEQTMFLLSTQENRHIFDNYRRGRNTFSVRAAADRSYSRYNEKLVDIAGGIGFLSNIYKDFATNQGYDYETLWPYIVDANYRDNMVGATVAFDHFTRELGRPEPGAHYFLPAAFGDASLRAATDADGNAGKTMLTVPNGTTGYLSDVAFGGHPLENGLAEDKGDYDADYEVNAGSYYEKINAAILLSLSEDRFISQSRQDFYDARFRAVGMADVLPEGYRRVLANALTGDRTLLGPRVTATNGVPDKGAVDAHDPKSVDAKTYPKNPLGWTSWWPTEGPVTCFARNGSNICAGFSDDGSEFKPLAPGGTVAIDPQIGWEVQKFLIAWTLAYIPADQKANWIDMMRIYRIGENADPTIDNRIEWEDPVSGTSYYARTYGKECLFGVVDAKAVSDADKGASCTASGGQWVQKGIAARVLEYSNFLTSKGYLADPAYAATNGFNDKGRFMFKKQPDGTPIVVGDPALQVITASGGVGASSKTCDLNVAPLASCTTDTQCANSGHGSVCDGGACTACTPISVESNHWSSQLAAYKEDPDYLWEVVNAYGLGTPDELGVFPN